tara:strand:- start:12076 stop:13122 length:1047 start_codon:yes stop_codon:yes gene_type:complete
MKIEAVALSLPERQISNDDILDYIREKSKNSYKGDLEKSLREVKFFLGLCGAQNRRWAAPGENTFKKHTEKAILEVLEKSNTHPEEIDLLIYSSVDRKVAEPNESYLLAKALGLKKTECFDILEACNSWSRATQISQSLLKSPDYRKVLVVTAEYMIHEGMWGQNAFHVKSPEEFEWKFPSYTLGEGSTATLLSNEGEDWNYKFLGMPEHADLCICPLENFNEQETNMNGVSVAMNGKGVFTSFGRKMEVPGKKALIDILDSSAVPLKDIDIIFPHSHAKKVWSDISKEEELNLPLYFIFPETGNLVTGSIPGAMSMAIEENALKRKDLVAGWMAAAGMSFSMYTFNY